MAHVLIPLPSRDFDPTEVAISWLVLTQDGHRVTFATPEGRPARADSIMISGRGLDPWSPVPGLGRLKLVGLLLRANSEARRAYREMIATTAYQLPERWNYLDASEYDALLLGGGHRPRGMRRYLESKTLQRLVAEYFEADKPVAAICHGVLLAARSRTSNGRSVLHGRKTTALTWKLEKAASNIARFTRFWDRDYYRTYTEKPTEPKGYMSVEQEVVRNLASPQDFMDVPHDTPHFKRKTSGLSRDTLADDTPAWVVRDGNYVSARWPGDAHTFAKTFAEVLARQVNTNRMPVLFALR
jgi:putative intracellular protease/amidase